MVGKYFWKYNPRGGAEIYASVKAIMLIEGIPCLCGLMVKASRQAATLRWMSRRNNQRLVTLLDLEAYGTDDVNLDEFTFLLFWKYFIRPL